MSVGPRRLFVRDVRVLALLVLASLLTLRRYRLRKGTIDAEQGIATRPARDVDAPASA